MEEPELLKLLMMHMSKNYHEGELQLFGDAEVKMEATIQEVRQESLVQGQATKRSIKR